MVRPRTLRGLLLRLANVYPKHALGALLVGACLLGVLVMVRGEDVEDCRFEQMWYAGSVHSNERIEFRTDSTGTWIQGGHDDHAGDERKDFAWERTASTLTVTFDGNKQKRVPYTIERRRNACYLTFEAHPLSDRSPFRKFADWADF